MDIRVIYLLGVYYYAEKLINSSIICVAVFPIYYGKEANMSHKYGPQCACSGKSRVKIKLGFTVKINEIPVSRAY